MYTKGDFHIHSTASDGDLKPREIVLLAKERNLDIIALTDHNTVAGNKEAVKVGKIHGIKVIPGIELSTRFKGVRVHILGYFTDNSYKSHKFKTTLNNINKRRSRDCKTYLEEKLGFTFEGRKLNTVSGIDFLHRYNAKVVLAHPTLLNRELFKDIINLNFDGIEAKYYMNSDEDTEYFIKLAKEKGLIYTAGSDFHFNKRLDLKHGTLGKIYLEEDEIKDFLSILG
ncbi:PHP domain-containing protein [Desnuesiella massiliensis]|uniref:PHP domain-containing protein n=1 Tax=Desnuesiella massiliensis TaxID=1650662 RepID=UPI0006E35C36|nr:PHP domain-containing protein [Desnuesiella massiliensis]